MEQKTTDGKASGKNRAEGRKLERKPSRDGGEGVATDEEAAGFGAGGC